MKFFLPAFALLFCGLLQAGLERAKAEPNLEKRSQLALDNAELALKEAREAYRAGSNARAAEFLAEVRSSVEYAELSLKETGKNPRRSPKYFKRAEMDVNTLLRKSAAFEQEMDAADRPMLSELKAKLQQVHEDLLHGVMGKSK